MGNCGQCPASTGTCQKCLRGFFLNSNSCSSCPTGCATCVSNEKCYSCIDGYTQVQNDDGQSLS